MKSRDFRKESRSRTFAQICWLAAVLMAMFLLVQTATRPADPRFGGNDTRGQPTCGTSQVTIRADARFPNA
jgi:hypothetical protein